MLTSGIRNVRIFLFFFNYLSKIGLSEVSKAVIPPVAPRAKNKNMPPRSFGCRSFALAFSSFNSWVKKVMSKRYLASEKSYYEIKKVMSIRRCFISLKKILFSSRKKKNSSSVNNETTHCIIWQSYSQSQIWSITAHCKENNSLQDHKTNY